MEKRLVSTLETNYLKEERSREKRRKRNRILGGLAVAVAIAASGIVGIDQVKAHKKATYLNENHVKETVTLPYFRLPAFRCAQYARMSAEELFGEKYVPCNAWDEKYSNKVVEIKGRLENAVPGQIVTFYDPKSNYSSGKDAQGNERNVSHAALVYGRDASGEPLILHQQGISRKLETLKALEERGLELRELIEPSE